MKKILVSLFFLFSLALPGYGQRDVSSLGPITFITEVEEVVNLVKQEFGFTFGAFLTEKKQLPKADFATYYQGVQESCGTECVTFRMKDLRTSKIIDGPANCPGGFLYFPNSYLIICNYDAIGNEGLLEYSWYTPRAFFWDEQRRDFFEIEGERRQ
jgi:hypothetical protein